MVQPMRVFVGSGRRHVVEEAVLAHSLVTRASRPVDLWVIDGDAHSLRRPDGSSSRPLPEAWRGRLRGATVFSMARFGVAELCDGVGRAIYCESDQVVLGDMARLWETDLGGADLAAVPYGSLRSASPHQSDGFLSSVLLVDASRRGGPGVVDVSDRVARGELRYEDAISMTDRFVETYGLRIHPLHPCWNDLGVPHPDTAVLHFTDKASQPWIHRDTSAVAVWLDEFVAARAAGAVDTAMVDRAYRLGGVARRLRVLARMPGRCVGPVDALWRRVARVVPQWRR